MTAPLTPERLAEIKAREQATTDGPWEADHADPGIWSPTVIVLGNYTAADDYDTPSWDDGNRNDREFIAHARTDIPELLAEVERLTRERDAYRKAKVENDDRFQNEAARQRERAERAEAALRSIRDVLNGLRGMGGVLDRIDAVLEGKP